MSLTSSTNSAAHKVLHLPEMLTMIAETCYDDAVAFYADADAEEVRPEGLANFVKVNRLCYDAAIHVLWRNLSLFGSTNLTDIFANVDLPRRNFLASFVQVATVCPERSARSAHARHLATIDFPKLQELHIDAQGEFKIQLPRLSKNNIRLVSCVHLGSFVGKSTLTPAVIDQCLESFPDLQDLRFSYPIPSNYHGVPVSSNNLGVRKLRDAGFEPVPGPNRYYWVAFSRKKLSSKSA